MFNAIADMVSTGGLDEVHLSKTNLCVNKFNSYISSVCHLGLPHAVNETASNGFVVYYCYILYSDSILVVIFLVLSSLEY